MAINIELYKKDEYSEDLISECEALVDSQHIDNGGTLRRRGLISSCSSLVCAKDENGKIIGFLALKDNYKGLKDIYISQMAVAKECVRKGVASSMIVALGNGVKNKYDFITADVRKDNIASNNLFIKLGFKNIENKLVRYSSSYVFDLRKLKKGRGKKKFSVKPKL